MRLGRECALALLFCVLSSCTADSGRAVSSPQPLASRYPAAVERQFMTGCKKAVKRKTGERICACSLDSVERRYSLKTFLAVDAQIRRGAKAPATLSRIGQSCALSVQ